MRRLLAQIAAMFLLVGVALAAFPARQSAASMAQASGAPLQPYRSPQGRFSVMFPAGTPQQSVKAITLKSGVSSRLHQIWVELGRSHVAYMVMYNDYPEDYVDQEPDSVLAAARRGATNGKTVLSNTAINLDGVPGLAFTATDRDGWHYTVRQFLAGERLYQLIVVSDGAHPAADADRFLNSFRIH